MAESGGSLIDVYG